MEKILDKNGIWCYKWNLEDYEFIVPVDQVEFYGKECFEQGYWMRKEIEKQYDLDWI